MGRGGKLRHKGVHFIAAEQFGAALRHGRTETAMAWLKTTVAKLGHHSYRGVCSHSSVCRISGVGWATKGYRASAPTAKRLWLGDRAHGHIHR